MMNKIKSPYSAAITGCGFQFYEFQRVFPLLMDANSKTLLQDEIENNRLLQVNSRKARRTFVLTFCMCAIQLLGGLEWNE